jgi:type I restriction enzyme R subunit
MFYGLGGRPLSAAEFVERLDGELPALVKDEAERCALWGAPDMRLALLGGLSDKGFGRDRPNEIAKLIDAEKSDLFDVLAYIDFALPTITRSERVAQRKSTVLSGQDPKLQEFRDFVPKQYVERGVDEVGADRLAPLLEPKYKAVSGTNVMLRIKPKSFRETFVVFQRDLFEE